MTSEFEARAPRGIERRKTSRSQFGELTCVDNWRVFVSEPLTMRLSLTTDKYQLYPSPRNTHRVIFEHQVFVPYPYALVDLPAMGLKGRYSLFAASRLADNKQGQLVSFENEADVTLFNARFEP